MGPPYASDLASQMQRGPASGVRACREDTDTARKGILDAVKVALKGDAADEAGAMLISRSWLRSWHTKQCRLVFLTDGAVSPTHAIVCRHGRLLPETHMKGCAPPAATRPLFTPTTCTSDADQLPLTYTRPAL